jgi:hypothetical protein
MIHYLTGMDRIDRMNKKQSLFHSSLCLLHFFFILSILSIPVNLFLSSLHLYKCQKQ